MSSLSTLCIMGKLEFTWRFLHETHPHRKSIIYGKAMFPRGWILYPQTLDLKGDGYPPFGQGTWDTAGYGRQVGGTCPTGMLSCYDNEFVLFMQLAEQLDIEQEATERCREDDVFCSLDLQFETILNKPIRTLCTETGWNYNIIFALSILI